MPSIYVPDAPPASAGSEDDEFADASGGVPGGWTEMDFASNLTVTEDEAGLQLVQTSHAGNSVACIYKAIPAGDFTYWTKVSLSGLAVTNYVIGGFCLLENASSSTGDIYVFQFQTDSAAAVLVGSRLTSYTTWAADLYGRSLSVDVFPSHVYLRLRRTGTTYSIDFSTDGIGWQRLWTGTLIFTPASIGLHHQNGGTGSSASARFPFFRYAASDVGATGTNKGDRVTFTGGGGGGGSGSPVYRALLGVG